MSSSSRPRLALTVGDPAGIGPEIALEAVAHAAVRRAARIVVIGPAALRPDHVALHAAAADQDLSWVELDGPANWTMGEASATAGRYALQALRAGADMASSGRVDALVTGPVCKRALHLAGEEVEGQTQLLARWAGVDVWMLAIADKLRVLLLTRHLPLRAALDALEQGRVEQALTALNEAMALLGKRAPRLAVAGLNPHAGESGLLGAEEGTLLEPAIRSARARGLDVEGPLSPDNIFLAASRGDYDGVLALYHDQAFVPIKLLSRGRGLTVLAGLPYLRVSPVHGTAFDIAGQGCASPDNLIHALRQTASWCRERAGRAPAYAPAT